MTHAQHTASSPEHSVWVGASAGTGKTKVLTDRVLRLLLQGVKPEKILCLTFTNAAAVEMASRIQKRLGEWVMLPETLLAKQLESLMGAVPLSSLLTRVRTLFAEVLEAPEGLNIQTIHAFCQSLINRFPLEAGISPNSQVIDEATARELLEEAKLRLLRGLYKKTDTRADEAIAALSWRLAESSFTELMAEIVNKSGAFARLFEEHPLAELEQKTYASLGAVVGVTAEEVLEGVCRHCEEAIRPTKQSISPHNAAQDGLLRRFTPRNDASLQHLAQAWLEGTDAEAKRGKAVKEWLALPLEGRIAAYPSYLSLFLTQDGEPRRLLNKATLERYPDIEAILQQEQERLLRAEEQRKSQLCAELSVHVLHIAESLLALYRDLKAARSFLDYNDLIHIGTSLIQGASASSWILYKLDGGIDHILVDEAQDTSPAQWDIVSALSAEFFSGEGEHESPRSLFVVGDEKQSIYSFQGADPRKFHTMQEVFAVRVQGASQSWQSIALDRSFRSTEAVLQAVDAIFAAPHLHKAISPASPVQHTAHRQGQAGVVEVWKPFAAEKEDTLSPWPLPNQRRANTSPATLLAEKIADTIAGWLTSKRLLVSKNRPVNAGDIMILVRTRGAFVDDMVRALKKRHIPVSGADRMMLMEHIAVMDLVALGKFLLLPQDDLNLATLLKTPFIGLSEEALFALAYNRKGSLWAALREKATSKDYQEAYRFLSSLLSATDFNTPFALFNDILDVRGGRKACISRLGHEVNDVLDEFMALALEYSKRYTPSLQGFLHWLETSQVQIKRDMEQGANQVRIMTIHGSKGLQAPIVFLPDTMKLPASKDKFLWTEGQVFWTGGRKNENSLCSQLYNANKARELEEYYRLLYVALTRPEDELYICGYHEKNKPSEKCWYTVITEGLKPLSETRDAEEPGDVSLRLTCEQKLPLPALIDIKHEANAPALPSHFLAPVPHEALPQKRRPSGAEETTSPLSGATLRGVLIHRLLEFLPSVPAEHRYAKAQAFLETYRNDFPLEEQEQILRDVDAALQNPAWVWLFSASSQAEVAVAGTVNGQAVTGQIDRLVVTEKEVWVVDYKTTPLPPESEAMVPSIYREQLALYKALIAPLYPDKTVCCALVWTATLTLMEIEEN